MDGCTLPLASEFGCGNDKMTALQLNKMKNQWTPPAKPFVVLDDNAFCGILHVQNTVATTPPIAVGQYCVADRLS